MEHLALATKAASCPPLPVRSTSAAQASPWCVDPVAGWTAHHSPALA